MCGKEVCHHIINLAHCVPCLFVLYGTQNSSRQWGVSEQRCGEERNVFYTECNRRNVRDFGRVFLRSNYTDITQNTYIQS